MRISDWSSDVCSSDLNLIYGGAPMPIEKFEQVREFFGPVVGATYGQTESPQIVTAITPAEFSEPANLGSAGRATWFSEFAIMDREGRVRPAGQAGDRKSTRLNSSH